MRTIKRFRVVTLAAACGLAGSPSFPAAAQTALETETTPLQTVTPPTPTSPLVINWNFFGGAGKANVTVNADGTWLFSGLYNGIKPNKDIDAALSLTASTGATVYFQYVGPAANGAQWSKQGRSGILQDNFAQFVGAGPDNWAGTYRFTETAAGKRAEYEAWEKKRQEAEKKREEARKEYEDTLKRDDATIAALKAEFEKQKREEARKEYEEALKRKDAKIAAAKAELEKQKQDEQAQAQAQAQAQRSSGGGSSVGSTIGTIAKVAGPIIGACLSFL
jgi:flagellar biosynthesis GTPase FlhF